jgi:hypothetical protein
MQRLDPLEISERGQRSRADLNELELVVYAVMTLEGLADMEGWTHFFESPHYAPLYSHVRAGLAGFLESRRPCPRAGSRLAGPIQ